MLIHVAFTYWIVNISIDIVDHLGAIEATQYRYLYYIDNDAASAAICLVVIAVTTNVTCCVVTVETEIFVIKTLILYIY